MQSSLMPREPDDDGFTVVELMVAIAIMLIVLSIATTGLIAGMQEQREQVAKTDVLNRTTIALERVTKNVRAADPITYAAADGIEVTVKTGPSTTVQRSFRVVDDGAGDKQLIACQSGYAGCVTGAGSVLVDNVVNDSATPYFTYVDSNGVDLGAPGSANLESVKEVEVQVHVAYLEAADPLEVNNPVRVRNWSQ